MHRTMAFLIFFTIVLSIYGLVNYYIYTRGLQAIPEGSIWRSWYQWGFWAIASFYISGRFLEKLYISYASDVLVWVGSFWLAAMFYFFLLVVALDILRMVNHFIPFFPDWVTGDLQTSKLFLLFGSIFLVTLLLTAGFINARTPHVKTVKIGIPKNAPGMSGLKAVVMSDIHLGTMIGNGFFERVVTRVNTISPDIILLPGDILDEDLEPVIRQNIGETLKQLSAPLGVYAIMGNHEHIGGASDAYEYLSKHGITILRDSVIKINDAFYLVGREDRDKARFGGTERVSLESLIEQTDNRFPVILLDHQPFYLEKAAELGVDLQLSGHTHHGQLWPLNYITGAIYTISRGYGMIGNMHAYVSSGLGTWGPPIRIGSRPEIVILQIQFDQADFSF
jgi:uncharacterized protein